MAPPEADSPGAPSKTEILRSGMEEASSLAREMALARPAMPAPTMRMSRGTGVGCIMIAWGWESVTAAESCFIPLAGVGEYNRILIAQPLRGGYKSHKSHRHGDGGGSDSQTMVHLGGPEMLIRDVCCSGIIHRGAMVIVGVQSCRIAN